MSYIIMKELQPLAKDTSYTKKELALNYPFLKYASTHVLYHAEKAQAGCITQALVQQPHREFRRLRRFHDIFEENSSLRYSTGANLLYALSLHGYHKLVPIVLLEKGANVNAHGGKCGTALQAASVHGQEATVALLLKKGADVNSQGGEYGNALQAASYCKHEAIVALLIEKGADVNVQGGDYSNALQAASVHGYKTAVALLLEKGADVNAQGGKYGNALQAASACGYGATVALLLEKGANVNAQGGQYGRLAPDSHFRQS
jgi:ankyrin repeat protein